MLLAVIFLVWYEPHRRSAAEAQFHLISDNHSLTFSPKNLPAALADQTQLVINVLC